MLKRMIALLAVLTLLSGCAAAETVSDGTRQIGMKTVPFYIRSLDNQLPGGFPLYFADGAEDLAYVDLSDWANLMNAVIPDPTEPKFDGIQVTAEADETENVVILKRENGHMMAVDFENSQIIWDDYIGFLQGTSGPYLDLSTLPETDAQGQPVYLNRVNTRERHGSSTLLKLSDYYGVSVIAQDGKYLVPLQTLSAFTLSPMYLGVYYNQECLIAAPIGEMRNIKGQIGGYLQAYGLMTPELLAEAAQNCATAAERKAYILNAVSQTEMGQAIIAQIQLAFDQSLYGLYAASSPKENRSEALTNYGYGELCMELDFFYGLKDAHNIDHFTDFFMQTEQAVGLLNPDPVTADQVIYEMTAYWLDDGHSGPASHSYLIDPDYTDDINIGFSVESRADLAETLAALRAAYPEYMQPYYEVGNTAYVTLDTFFMNPAIDYYAAAEKGELPDPSTDTISLIYYAHQQITREDSPIENVVLDLSLNEGGTAPAAIWTLGWFLGDAQVSVSHTATGAEATIAYRADVNLDHQYDEKDTISSLNLYCLTSPRSFSCGNLVPWAFKADGRVTLLGRVTGGGSCSVNYMTTAWGTSYQLSGPMRISFMKNGAYYDVDQGAEPDYFIRDYRNFYDRNALTEIISSLR